MDRYLVAPSFDGPSDTRSHGGSQRSAGSQAYHPSHGGPSHPAGSHVSASQPGGSRAGGSSRPPSNIGIGPGPVGYPAPLGYDPARMGQDSEESPEEMHRKAVGKRVDLPAEAYAQAGAGQVFAQRPGLGKGGKPVSIRVNQFRVCGLPNFDIFQYDISITPEPKKNSFVRKIWETETVKRHMRENGGPHPWVFDGRKLAWSRNNVSEMRLQVNMDAEQGRQSRPNRDPDVVYVIIKKTTTIRLDALKAYLLGKMGWDDHVLECMNFLDHVMREWPAQHMVAIKRNLYPKSGYEQALLDKDRWLIAIKGIYSSIRTNSSIKSGGYGLGINVDIANTAFWSPDQNSIAHLAFFLLKSAFNESRNPEDWQIAEALKPERVTDGNRQGWGKPLLFTRLEKMKNLTFRVVHRGKMNDSKRYKIKGFTWDLNKWPGPEGANARNVTFEKRDVTTGEVKTISIAEYFRDRYEIRLNNWQLPCIVTTRDGIFPMEVCVLDSHQKYNYKLDGDQTSAMIKFAVTRPPRRAQDIMGCVQTLRWNQDPYLREYGLQIKGQMETVKARVINNPTIQFGKATKNPGMGGRWDLRGQVFTKPNTRPLRSWGVIIIGKCVDNASAMNFISTFIKAYKGHGGKVETTTPPIKHVQMSRSSETGEQLKQAYQEVGMQFKQSPDLLFVILPNKDMITYERLKKSFDIRFATLSQMVQASHVRKAQDQYCSNVAMKVNAKLGGYTSKLVGKAPLFGNTPTMMIGVDVTHGQHGQGAGPQASLAAVTMSMDKDCVQYAACCQTNGYRVEVLNRECVQKTVGPLIEQWCALNQKAPQHVFYFRDGVSEGEFSMVLSQEIDEVRRMFFEKARGAKPKITVIVGTKRHHIRFFPEGASDGDKNGNPFPGTIVETEVTHPFHYDFYLCSHFALQGTARPVHYQVLLDEINMPVDLLQTMIYQQCYQYMRSTTPVSLHPAIYYAHLAAARARPHEDITASASDPRNRADQQRMPLARHNAPAPSSKLPTTAADLMNIGDKESGARDDNIKFFKSTMWFI